MAYIYNGGFESKTQNIKSGLSTGRSGSVNSTTRVNITKSFNANAKPRLYQPKTTHSNTSVNTNNNKTVTAQNNIKKPISDVKSAKTNVIVNVKKPLTFFERLTEIEETFKTAIEQAESQLFAIANEMELSQQTIDEAKIYCDKSETRVELFAFHNEVIDISQKMNIKRDALSNLKTNYLNAMHEYSRFLSGNFFPFKEAMDLKLKRIEETVAAKEAAENEEKERIRLNPPLRLIETKEQGVQVRPESLIYFSPTAGVLRSTIKQRVVMPIAPVLKTELTPTSSLYGSSHLYSTFQAPRNSTINESVCDDSVISALPRSSNNCLNELQNLTSPFSKRLTFF